MKGKMSSDEIREKFFNYFEKKGHMVVPSSSIVPHEDDTLLFVNAGMVQFKDVFLGNKKLSYSRAVTAQKCVRAGGKHNDLESVGRTARHHTFFEMLGNFSFGDYFKEEAIIFAWEFLTQELKLPKEKLWITIYNDDDEAFDLWQKIASVPSNKIIRLGEEDNFWSMGDVGPCGPCSEVFFDRGEKERCDAKDCEIGKCDCDRWMEIWNLVFMQFNKDDKGNLTKLPKPSIDTGMGLERMATVMQNVYSNYDIDIIRPLISFIENETSLKYKEDEKGFPFRVLADHARASTFLISDGVIPSNEGRGYVLRRIMRRAIRYCKVLGQSQPFLYKIVPQVVKIMGDAYPKIREMNEYIQSVIKSEEEKFLSTLNDGIILVNNMIEKLNNENINVIPGEEVFKLYDTFGFPVDLTEDIAKEHNMSIDKESFEYKMKEQRERAKANNAFKTKKYSNEIENIIKNLKTEFVGYRLLNTEAKVLLIINNNTIVENVTEGDTVEIILDKTPFYSEAGGQAGDTGILINEGFEAEINDTIKNEKDIIIHKAIIKKGQITKNSIVEALVDKENRHSTARNHTTTHILHKALIEKLGKHIKQAGSFVTPNRLRFDFSHYKNLTHEEIENIEDKVNGLILKNINIIIRETTTQDAIKSGAIALFGEKYGEKVRVVEIDDFSKELCGGTHVSATGEIGLFKIISENSIGSGLRRIEAVTGEYTLNLLRTEIKRSNRISKLLKCKDEEIENKINEIVMQIKDYGKMLNSYEDRLLANISKNLVKEALDINNIKIISSLVEVSDIDALRKLTDIIKNKTEASVIILGASFESKANLIVSVSKGLHHKGLHAGNIIKDISLIIGGGGGGRPDMAQAGGKNPDKLNDAINYGVKIVKECLESNA